MIGEWLEIASDSPAATEAIAGTLAGILEGGDLLAVEGPLGAGKTCFARGLAAGLGIDPDEVSSPSFVLLQRYGPGVGGALAMNHVDAYRVEGASQLAGVGLEELLEDRGSVTLAEWPSRIEAALPVARIEVRILPDDAGNGERRRIRLRDLRGSDAASRRFRDAMETVHGAVAVAEDRCCPICGGTLAGGEGESPPFCSARCRMADLGRWFRGEYAVSRPLEAEETDEA
jgi:tRNA threonylcarbamoyladenosine biosynthesis protein TsaE